MRLDYNDWFADIKCPNCGSTYDVVSTYEEHMTDCEGSTSCPNCEEGLIIEAILKFSVKTKKDDNE